MRLAALALVLCSLSPAYADGKKPPERMSLEEAARLDAAFAHRQLIFNRAAVDAMPFDAVIAAICRAHKIDPRDLGKGTGVDVTTGAISRTPPEPKASEVAKPPTKK